MNKDQIARLICHMVGCVVAVYILYQLLPYIVIFLAVCGAWYLLRDHNNNHRGRGGGCNGCRYLIS